MVYKHVLQLVKQKSLLAAIKKVYHFKKEKRWEEYMHGEALWIFLHNQIL